MEKTIVSLGLPKKRYLLIKGKEYSLTVHIYKVLLYQTIKSKL
jgi:hypothetical protein